MLRRRDFLTSAAAASSVALLGRPSLLAKTDSILSGQAEHVISIWLGGGMGQIDTFDPKALGEPVSRKPGSYYQAIDTCVPGVQVCEHLPRIAGYMEHVTAVRSVHHDVIDEHAAATNRMHTGRPVSGTVVYPSLGSIVASQKGALIEGVPPYILIGIPNVTRGPGFLGAKHGYLYLTDTSQGPMGLSRPSDIPSERQLRRDRLLTGARTLLSQDRPALVQEYETTIDQRRKLTETDFMTSFDIEREPPELRNRYGGEFGQRCLLGRRLIERGVRFVEISHNLNFINGAGWDVHNAAIEQQHLLIRELDAAVGSLIEDLRSKQLLDKTLIAITTEFGRPPEFDSGGGRGHQGSAFTCVLAGGGLKHQGAYGATDELAKKIVEAPVGVPDLFATIHAALGIDYTANLYDGDRPVPITDMGQPIAALF